MLICWKERCLRGREAVGILTTKKYFRQRVDYFLDNFRKLIVPLIKKKHTTSTVPFGQKKTYRVKALGSDHFGNA